MRLDPVLWAVAGNALAQVETALRSAVAGDAGQQAWILAEDRGALVGDYIIAQAVRGGDAAKSPGSGQC